MSKYERLARMLKIITLVKANPKLKRTDLARLCEVSSVRTIQRDIKSLAIAEVPIFWSGEGYEIMPNFFLPPLAFSVEEALSMILCAKAYRDGEGKFHESVIESAISKIVATLSRSTKELLELESGKISVESRKTADVGGMLSQLYQAILSNKQLIITYYSFSSNSVSERVIDPYALTFRKQAWYLVAFCHTRGRILTFRTNRIRKAEYTGNRFSYPSDFSLKNYMDKSWHVMNGEETEVVVKFDAKVAPLIKEVEWHPTQEIEDLPDGAILYTVTVAGIKEISFWILGYGQDAEVISPQKLRDEIAAVARKMCQHYERSQSSDASVSHH